MNRIALLGLLCAAGAIAGCGGSTEGAPPSPKARASKATTKFVHKEIARAAVHPDEWFTYTQCHSAHSCKVELRWEGDPETTLAVDHYRVRGGRVVREGAANIEVALISNALTAGR